MEKMLARHFLRLGPGAAPCTTPADQLWEVVSGRPTRRPQPTWPAISGSRADPFRASQAHRRVARPARIAAHCGARSPADKAHISPKTGRGSPL